MNTAKDPNAFKKQLSLIEKEFDYSPDSGASSSPNIRRIIAFPEVDEFFYMLQDRLHMIIDLYVVRGKFTLFVNAYPRKRVVRVERGKELAQGTLGYIGVDRQRELLERENPIPEIEQYWNRLNPLHTVSDTPTVSSNVFNRACRNELSEDSIKVGYLRNYFAPILDPESTDRVLTENQKMEYQILNAHFNVETDHFLSVPLIQFGEFDGVVHIVFEHADFPRLVTVKEDGSEHIRKGLLRAIIRGFTSEYEGLILNWDLVGENLEKSSELRYIFNEEFYHRINTNPILKELDFLSYYLKYKPYYDKRFKYGDSIPEYIFRAYLKVAIMSILVDSYAHNVSAHSLTALNWILKRRAAMAKLKPNYNDEKRVNEIEEILGKDIRRISDNNSRLRELLAPYLKGEQAPTVPSFSERAGELPFLLRYQNDLSRELQPLVNFLAEKGAFWSGVTRDYNFGGEATNLFDTLWLDFINNPLYLGTIAKTEDITRVNFKFVLHQSTKVHPDNPFVIEHEPMLEGILAVIDINAPRPEDEEDENGDKYVSISGNRLYHRQYRELEDRSMFVQPGNEYVGIRHKLSDCCKVFFPGGVVGRHAFFTILENEIRNVKHYSGQELKRMQKEGITLVISMEQTNIYNKKEEDNELYKIGVWLEAPTKLVQPQSTSESPYLVKRRYDTAKEKIMTSRTFNPKLGGNFQDKICASMLFNNVFSHVQRGDSDPFRPTKKLDTEKDKLYYPWIISAVSTLERPNTDFELSRKSGYKDHFTAESFEKLYPFDRSARGYFKKYFYLWKGQEVLCINADNASVEDTFKVDNLSRFKFICFYGEDEQRINDSKQKARKAGVIRVLSKKLDEGDTLGGYRCWLPTWFGPENKVLELVEKSTTEYGASVPIGYIEFEGKTGSINFSGSHSLQHAQHRTLFMAHSGTTEYEDDDVIRYRTHGLYKQHYFEDGLVGVEQQKLMAELFEVLETKICIFDNRVKHRLRMEEENRKNVFKKHLKLVVGGEQPPYKDSQGRWTGDWENELKASIVDCQLLVLHLTYIDSILSEKYTGLDDSDREKIEESTLGFFIENEILPAVTKDGENLPENFVFIVTTGRGRTEWWDKLMESPRYSKFASCITFRPVESIITVMENAVNKKDDIELKHNLVKVLLGS